MQDPVRPRITKVVVTYEHEGELFSRDVLDGDVMAILWSNAEPHARPGSAGFHIPKVLRMLHAFYDKEGWPKGLTPDSLIASWFQPGGESNTLPFCMISTEPCVTRPEFHRTAAIK